MSRKIVKAMVSLVALGVVLSVIPAQAQPRVRGSARVPDVSVTWSAGPTSPFAGTRFDGALVNGRVYFLGFRTVGDATDGSVWYFDLATQTYVDTLVDMKAPISNYQIAVLRDPIGTGLYIFGGRDANAQILNLTQVYYPATNTAKIVTTDPWPGTTPSGCISLPAMGVATAANHAYVMGGVAFVTNGCVLDENSAQTWVYDPMAPAGTRWTQGPDLNVARGYITPAVAHGRIYAIGGDVAAANPLLTAVRTVEAWTPPAGTWTNAPRDLPVTGGCDESQAFLVELPFSIVLAGCGQWPNAIPDTLSYNIPANTWSPAGALSIVRRNHAGALLTIGGRPRLYVLGGYAGPTFVDPLDSSELGAIGPFAAPHGRGSLNPVHPGGRASTS
jgi:Kelch motif protein